MRAMKRLPGQRGAVAVEFALIMIPLFLFLFGAIEFGRTYSQLQVYNGGAREMTRCLAVQAADLSDCDPYDRLTSHLGGYEAPLESEITVTVTGPLGGSATLASGTVECTNNTRGETVTASWMQDFDLNVPFWKIVTITREIKGVFRCE